MAICNLAFQFANKEMEPTPRALVYLWTGVLINVASYGLASCPVQAENQDLT
ncbi:hypothetical protein PENANT_c003G05148 [Penicillium antarcticum]|uniref:Uncharacterized protein n=1 Tax=Penicillium antarcticum TaxID=416450 RepID=A0A1V6QID6_9EURO|nr:hypothetical protein PENANT_c003G05148 [Penicillium antarcticum]